MMSAWVIGIGAFVCVLGGAVAGLLLRNTLPDHHLTGDSRDAVKMGSGLIATLCALVLSLLVSSAKNSFDEMGAAISQGSAKLIMLDRTMVRYGPETEPIRQMLRSLVAEQIKICWPEQAAEIDKLAFETPPAAEAVMVEMLGLTPQNDWQRMFQSEAVQLCREILQVRWLTIERAQLSLPPVFYLILLSWLVILFGSIGLCAPSNKTVLTVLIVCAISVGGAVFLIEEMNRPLSGLVKVSGDPLLRAVEHIGR
ncbi:MAG: DUF4239 domain-containing protein [Planctomycetales bacterium]|nr:DUF4239 domain-containing protein [Planctomycetales bacterium]